MLHRCLPSFIEFDPLPPYLIDLTNFRTMYLKYIENNEKANMFQLDICSNSHLSNRDKTSIYSAKVYPVFHTNKLAKLLLPTVW